MRSGCGSGKECQPEVWSLLGERLELWVLSSSWVCTLYNLCYLPFSKPLVNFNCPEGILSACDLRTTREMEELDPWVHDIWNIPLWLLLLELLHHLVLLHVQYFKLQSCSLEWQPSGHPKLTLSYGH